MTELLTAAQMRAIEKAAIDSGEVTGLELMERAGQGVVEAIFEEWPELAKTDHRAVVLCGPGNNGGDGFVVARLLKEWGWEVEVFLYGDAGKLPVDARVNYERWGEMGEVMPISEFDSKSKISFDYDQIRESDILVDALFGIGFRGCLPQLWAPLSVSHSVIDDARDCGAMSKPYIIAIDVPSGLDSDTGESRKDTQVGDWGEMAAHLTVTFHAKKPGHVINEGVWASGKIRVASIGL